MSQGRLIDADTLDLPGYGRVRLAGVDAPENGQPAQDAQGREFDAGAAATEAFGNYLKDRQNQGWQVHIESAAKGRDFYGRILGRIILRRDREEEDACAWMVRNGWAVAEYSPPDYRFEERLARRNRAGLWAGEWQRPKDWRAAGKGMPLSAGSSSRPLSPGQALSLLSQLLSAFARIFRPLR